MTTVITTNVNIENEIKAIKQLEAEIKNLSEIKKDKENSIKSIMEQAGLETMDIAGYVINGGMIIEITEKSSDKEPYGLDIDDLKIGFIVGYEECDYDYDTGKYLGKKPFERLYTGEECVKISCSGNYAFPEFIQMWNGFINQYEIEELTDTKEIKQVA